VEQSDADGRGMAFAAGLDGFERAGYLEDVLCCFVHSGFGDFG